MRTGRGQTRTLLLRQARERLRINQVGRQYVAELVARVMCVPKPHTRDGQYSLLARFVALPFSEAVLRAAAITHPPLPAQKQPKPSKVYVPKYEGPDVVSDAFLQTYEWRQLRMIVLKKRGARCECCGATPANGIVIHVDHIKPRRKHPELALTESNLQVLCEVCNHGKGSWDQTDWRADHAATARGKLEDSPVPGTATAASMNSALRPRLIRRS